MKKKTSILFIVITLIISANLKNRNTNLKKISSLSLENIEALASNENNDGLYKCYGLGSIDCFGQTIKVELVVTEKPYNFFDVEDIY